MNNLEMERAGLTCPEYKVGGGLTVVRHRAHDWRLHKEQERALPIEGAETMTFEDLSRKPVTLVLDYVWYCTRCRRVEVRAAA